MTNWVLIRCYHAFALVGKKYRIHYFKKVIKLAKSAREKIRLVSSAGTGHFYTTDKNKRNMPEKMEIKKYDPKVRKHVIYTEAKIK